MTNGNDAAFARPLGEVTNPGEPAVSDEQPGLTKREYFAAMAIQGLCSADFGYPTKEILAKDAVRYADALIAELNKEQS